MDINKVTAVYFVGAGGIGMSALIRYFLAKGKRVGGYDKTPSDLTEELKKEAGGLYAGGPGVAYGIDLFPGARF